MSKKLLIAVLTLGFLFTLSGAVISSGPGDQEATMLKTNPNAKFSTPEATQIPTNVERFGKPVGQDEYFRNPNPAPPSGPPPHDCSYQNYAINQAWATRIPATSTNRDFLAMRFSPTAPYTVCTLTTAYIMLYPALFIGTPDLVVGIWDDDGFGYPGVDSTMITIPFASLPTATGYYALDLSSYNLTFSGDFFVGIASGTPGAFLATLMDDGTAGQGRSYVHQGTPRNWFTRAELLYPDYNFDFGVDVCCAAPAYSSCYHQEYDMGAASYWGLPSLSSGRNFLNMRFSVTGPETIAEIGMAFYDLGPQSGDINLTVWADDGTGLPDPTQILFTTTILFADVIYYPDFVTANPGILVRGDFHVGASVSGGQHFPLSDDGTGTNRRSSGYWPAYGWLTIWDAYGSDENFLIYAEMCKDMFETCQTVPTYSTCDPYYVIGAPRTSGRVGGYQQVDPFGLGCRLEKVRVALDDYGGGAQFDSDVEVEAYASNGPGGSPGTKLGGVVVPAAQLVVFPDMVEVDFYSQNIIFDGPIYVGVKTLQPTLTPIDLYIVADDATCGKGQAWALYQDGHWTNFASYAGLDINFFFEADLCCVPPPERTCMPGEDWPTAAHDFRRSSASFNSTSNAKCTEALLYAKFSSAGFTGYNRPAIYGNIFVVAWNTLLAAYDLPTGTLLWSKVCPNLPTFGTGQRTSPTIKDGFVYANSGNGRGVVKLDVTTGAVIWARSITNAPFTGNTLLGHTVILNVGGTDVLFIGTTAGEVYAIDCASPTGANFAGWTAGAGNPQMVNGDVWGTLSSNGTDVVYVGTDGAFEAGYGKLYAFDAATGATLWTIEETTGLMGHDLDGDVAGDLTTEIFRGPISVDVDGSLYFITGFNSEIDGTPSGAYYKAGADGTVKWGMPGKFAYYSGPVIDANLVYMTVARYWTSEAPVTVALSKLTGSVVWTSDPFFDGQGLAEGALSCEPLLPDLLYQGNRANRFMVWNTDNGNAEFEYTWKTNTVSGNVIGAGIAIAPSNVVMTNRQGDVYVMAPSVDRPRLRILKSDVLISVPFFSPVHTPVQYDSVFMNNGCVNLTGSFTASSTPSAIVTGVNPDRIVRMGNVADQMVDNSYPSMTRHLVRADNSDVDADFVESALSKDNYSNTSAYAPPSWLWSITPGTFDLAPGELGSITYDVNGPLVTRGPHYCYVTIASNDQYYLNSTAAPVVQLGVLGGCMKMNTELPFGVTSQNVAKVYNTGELENNDYAGWEWDGVASVAFQGMLMYAVSEHRKVWRSTNWVNTAVEWDMLLPDVNCKNICGAYLTPSAIPLGPKMWDGTQYNDVMGNVSHVRYIDSAINFACTGTWNWQNYTCGYAPDSTIGISVDQAMYGVVGEAGYLNNVVIYKLDISNRNATTTLPVYLGGIMDWDINSKWDVAKFDAAHSISWQAGCNQVAPQKVYGMGKIPMDVDPMIGSRTLDGDQSMYSGTYAFDSMFRWMSTQPGETWQAGIDNNIPCGVTNGTPQDRDAQYSFVSHAFGPNEIYTTGVYIFGFNAADAQDAAYFADFATFVNQFAGFGRGDINNDGKINLADVVALWNMVNAAGQGPLFDHLGDVNADNSTDNGDVLYLANYWFCAGPAAVGAWKLADVCAP